MDREAQTCSETVYPLIVRREYQTQRGSHSKAATQWEKNRHLDSPSGLLSRRVFFGPPGHAGVEEGAGGSGCLLFS